MTYSLFKEAIELNEEQMIIESIALFEDVAKAMQPYVALINAHADGKKNPFDANDKTRRIAYAEDFGSIQKDFEFLTNVGKPVKKFGEGENQTAQQRIIEIGKSAKTLWDEYKDRIANWTDSQVRTKLINEIKKLVNDWDRQLNALKTEYNKVQMNKA